MELKFNLFRQSELASRAMTGTEWLGHAEYGIEFLPYPVYLSIRRQFAKKDLLKGFQKRLLLDELDLYCGFFYQTNFF